MVGLFLVVFTLLGKFGNLFSSDICANSISCIKNLSGNFYPQEELGVYLNQKLTVPLTLIAKETLVSNVLGDTSAHKKIEVDLSRQRLYAFENGIQVFEFPVSSGKWYPTPTGKFKIWIKLRYTKMEGGNQALGTYYYLPNVPYVMFYYNDKIAKSRGFSLHGTYWHDNFGHPMSHGCINMRTEDVAKLYAWATPAGGEKGVVYASNDDPGTEIFIYGGAPKE